MNAKRMSGWKASGARALVRSGECCLRMGVESGGGGLRQQSLGSAELEMGKRGLIVLKRGRLKENMYNVEREGAAGT